MKLLPLLCFWQCKPELYAFWQVFYAALPILHGDDILYNIEPQAYMGKGVCFFFLGGKKAIPDFFQLLLGNWLAGIVNPYADILLLLF